MPRGRGREWRSSTQGVRTKPVSNASLHHAYEYPRSYRADSTRRARRMRPTQQLNPAPSGQPVDCTGCKHIITCDHQKDSCLFNTIEDNRWVVTKKEAIAIKLFGIAVFLLFVAAALSVMEQ